MFKAKILAKSSIEVANASLFEILLSRIIEANKHIFAEHLLDLMRLVYVVFILMLVLITSAQCQQTAEDWTNKGNALSAQGKYNEAIKAFDEAIRLNPNDAVTWSNKGIALFPGQI